VVVYDRKHGHEAFDPAIPERHSVCNGIIQGDARRDESSLLPTTIPSRAMDRRLEQTPVWCHQGSPGNTKTYFACTRIAYAKYLQSTSLDAWLYSHLSSQYTTAQPYW
jgi:hypothetical protein